MAAYRHALSKSRFVAGRQCIKRLYLETHHRDLAAEPSAAQQRIFDTGHRVGELACQEYPSGVLIEAGYNAIDKALADTEAALEAGERTLFEPAFLFRGVLVRVDILTRNEDETWDIIEVKSTTKVSDTHLADVAVQRYVISGSGLTVRGCYVMHLNRGCRYPDLSDLFTRSEVTQTVEVAFPDIAEQVEEFTRVLLEPAAPDISIGTHCTSPYTCPFKDHCWSEVTEPSIFSIPRLNAIKTREPRALWPAIAAELGELEYPMYFLDFETNAEAVPRLDDLGPYSPYPFQYSLHILHEGGELEHCEYLHTDRNDPRRPLAEHLLSDIGSEGSLIAYNASFEKRVISSLAMTFPPYRKELRNFASRFFDLLPVFRDLYIDPAFGGSASIKRVLPVVVPELSYAGLDVQSGDVAQSAWWEMIETKDEARRGALAESLRAYCALDTLAMVRLYQRLKEMLREQEL